MTVLEAEYTEKAKRAVTMFQNMGINISVGRRDMSGIMNIACVSAIDGDSNVFLVPDKDIDQGMASLVPMPRQRMTIAAQTESEGIEGLWQRFSNAAHSRSEPSCIIVGDAKGGYSAFKESRSPDAPANFQGEFYAQGSLLVARNYDI